MARVFIGSLITHQREGKPTFKEIDPKWLEGLDTSDIDLIRVLPDPETGKYVYDKSIWGPDYSEPMDDLANHVRDIKIKSRSWMSKYQLISGSTLTIQDIQKAYDGLKSKWRSNADKQDFLQYSADETFNLMKQIETIANDVFQLELTSKILLPKLKDEEVTALYQHVMANVEEVKVYSEENCNKLLSGVLHLFKMNLPHLSAERVNKLRAGYEKFKDTVPHLATIETLLREQEDIPWDTTGIDITIEELIETIQYTDRMISWLDMNELEIINSGVEIPWMTRDEFDGLIKVETTEILVNDLINEIRELHDTKELVELLKKYQQIFSDLK